MLGKIGVSIEEIKEYLCSSYYDSFEKILERKRKLIEDSIKQLSSVETFLNEKANRIQLALQAKHGDISIINQPERKIVLSEPFLGMSKYDETSVAAGFSLRLKKLFSLYDSFGTRISIDSLNKKKFDCYDWYFAYCPTYAENYDEVIPKGTYIQAFCIGAWDKLPEIYTQIFQFAEKHSLELTGYAYEEGLNEMSIGNMGIENIALMDEYISRITVGVNKNNY